MTKPAPPRAPVPRLVVNLDAVGALFDRLLAHPAAGALEAVAPELHQAIVDAREDLTGVAATLVGKAHDYAMGEVDRRAAKAVRRITGKQKRAKPQPKRLPR